jgi:Firmicute plasmid replication protein (RepL).
MRGGYADSVELFWFDGGLSGRDIGMSEKTFQRGLKELLAKGFIAAKTASSFWVNPALFFKGDRVMFIKEYRRRTTSAEASTLEQQGQLSIDA